MNVLESVYPKYNVHGICTSRRVVRRDAPIHDMNVFLWVSAAPTPSTYFPSNAHALAPGTSDAKTKQRSTMLVVHHHVDDGNGYCTVNSMPILRYLRPSRLANLPPTLDLTHSSPPLLSAPSRNMPDTPIPLHRPSMDTITLSSSRSPTYSNVVASAPV